MVLRRSASMRSSALRWSAASLAVLSSPTAFAAASMRVVGRDLERLGRALVLGVLEHALALVRRAHDVERALGEHEHLADGVADEAGRDGQRAAAAVGAEIGATALDRLDLVARLLEVALEQLAVAARRSSSRCGR